MPATSRMSSASLSGGATPRRSGSGGSKLRPNRCQPTPGATTRAASSPNGPGASGNSVAARSTEPSATPSSQKTTRRPSAPPGAGRAGSGRPRSTCSIAHGASPSTRPSEGAHDMDRRHARPGRHPAPRTTVRAREPVEAAGELRQDHVGRATAASDEALRERAELVADPPPHQPAELRTSCRIGAPRLGHERHEAEAPGPVLAAKRLERVAMLVAHRHGGDVDERMAGAQHAVEDVEVAAPGQRRAGVERRIEAAERQQHVPAKGHVAARAEDAGAGGVVGHARLRRPGPAQRRAAAAKPTAAFEDDLRLGGERKRQDQAGQRARVGMHAGGAGEAAVPSGIHHRVVVDEGQPVPARLAERPIAGDVEPRRGLADASDSHGGRDLRRLRAGRRIVDHQHVDGRRRVGRRPAHALQAAPQPLRPVLRAHRDGERRRQPICRHDGRQLLAQRRLDQGGSHLRPQPGGERRRVERRARRSRTHREAHRHPMQPPDDAQPVVVGRHAQLRQAAPRAPGRGERNASSARSVSDRTRSLQHPGAAATPAAVARLPLAAPQMASWHGDDAAPGAGSRAGP